MYVFLSKIYTAVLVLLLVSCKTIDYNYSLIAKYIVLPDTKEKNKIEVLEGINEFLVSHGFITNLSFNNLTIETEWQQASTTANDAMNIIKQTNNLTTGNHNPNNNQYTTQIKYYFFVSENNYTVWAEMRVIDNKAVFNNQRKNNISNVLPNSEFWEQMRLMVQEINYSLDINRYNLITERWSKK